MRAVMEHSILLSCLCTRTACKLAGYVFLLIVGLSLLFFSLTVMAPKAEAASRLKDIVSVEGIRENVLVGYGLVVGLNGTGDKLDSSAFTEKSLVSFLSRLGINTRDDELKTKNVAAVTLTAVLPPFARAGSRIDITASTLGDAKSLQGGILLASPLMGADGEVYAVAQGPISIEGFEAGGEGASVSKGVPTVGFMPNGAIIEKEITFDLNSLKELNLSLRNPDVSTAGEVARVINEELGDATAKVKDPGTVNVMVPEKYQDSVAGLLAQIEHLEVEPDQVARVMIDEASGTIVMGQNVRVDKVAVAQGNLVVKIQEIPAVSQPGALAPEGAETVETTVTDITVSEGDEDRKLTVLRTGASLHELVSGLNALGVGPRDLISILQTIRASGALQADIALK